jgi:hypothetical protein
MPSWVSKPPKRAQLRAAMPSASSFVLLENEEQFIHPPYIFVGNYVRDVDICTHVYYSFIETI